MGPSYVFTHIFCKFKELYSKKTLLQRGKESGVIKDISWT